MSKITVYTKTYNRMELLPRAIESVLSQSFTDFTYVIYDNGSTDDTSNVIKRYAKTDSRIQHIYTKVNTQTGEPEDPLFIEAGDNIWFTQVDDDDYIDADMLKELYGLAKQTGSDVVTVGSLIVNEDGNMQDKFVYAGQYDLNRVEAMYELLKREHINSAKGGKLYKKKLLYGIDRPKVKRIRDIHWEYRVFERIRQMTITGKPMYYFYRHSANQSGLNNKDQITPEMMEEHLYANRIRTEYLTEKMPEIADFALYSEYSFMISLTHRIRDLHVEDCYPIADRMAETLQKNKEWLLACGELKEREIAILNSL